MTYKFEDPSEKSDELPAGQRGIGCGMMLLLPAISYVAAIELLKITEIKNFFIRVSPKLFGAPSIPSLLWKIKAIDPFLRRVYSWNNLEVNLLFGSLILLVLSGLIGMIYAFTYRAVTGSRYGRLDAPPPRHKPTKKSR
ncbi:MAG: hypothetical protein GY755_20310 [Chloroflexi bacterium]|nr:hypothetical protein [Chloroflexota bacterium]